MVPNKASLRVQVREAIRALSPAKCAAESLALCQVALAAPLWRDAASILLFARLPDEPDVTLLMESAWHDGKIVSLPRFDATSGTYVAAQVRSRTDLRIGRFQVLEPSGDCPLVSLNQLDLVFAPGVAFDLAGRRLGRGKGFYDRLLAEVQGHKCGVAFAEQIVAAVPEEPHDMRVNSILTPLSWRACPDAA